MNTGKELLHLYRNTAVTLSAFSETGLRDQRRLDCLHSAALMILADKQNYSRYMVMAHSPGNDITLSQSEMDAVLDVVASEG